MSNQVIPAVKSEVFTESQVQLIQNTICKGSTFDQFKLFLHVCEKSGLDPMSKQIYAVVRNTKDGPAMAIQSSIDGLRLIADRTGNYCPGDESTFKYDDKGKLVCATSYVKKRTKDGQWHVVSASAHYEEYRPRDWQGKVSANNFWDNKPHIMLAKCAEALALRKAFPAEMCGIYAKEEMDQEEHRYENKFDVDMHERVTPVSKKSKHENHVQVEYSPATTTVKMELDASTVSNEVISPEEADDIKRLLGDNIDRLQGFCDYYKIAGINMLPRSKLKEAMEIASRKK